jgi:vacuolar-type H+-ATPase subunit H
MSRESILKIKEAEARADRLVAGAKEQARDMLRQAEAEGQALCDKTECECTAELSAMLGQLRERTAQMRERMEAEAHEEIEALEASVSLRRKVAEKIIIGGLERICR